MSDYLPEEVIVEILWRLPIRTILRCTSVCKLWYSLIKNPNFISTHLHRSISWRNNLLLLSERCNPKNIKLHFDNNDFEEYMPFDPPFDCLESLGIAGSCNGIICMYTFDYICFRFILWNPSIRKYLLVPSPQFRPNCVLFVGFGFDSETHNYKVLRMLDNFSTELYSLKENSWKDITDITPKFAYPSYLTNSVFVNGALHWIAMRLLGTNGKHKHVVMVFDLRDEAFHEIILPQLIEYHWNLTVGVFGESSIAVFHRKFGKQTDIWVMKEYGVVSSWTMLGTVGRTGRGKLQVLGFRNNGDVLLQFYPENKIVSQNIKSPQVKIHSSTSDRDYEIRSYEKSLQLLGEGNDASSAATSGPSDAKRSKISNWLQGMVETST